MQGQGRMLFWLMQSVILALSEPQKVKWTSLLCLTKLRVVNLLLTIYQNSGKPGLACKLQYTLFISCAGGDWGSNEITEGEGWFAAGYGKRGRGYPRVREPFE